MSCCNNASANLNQFAFDGLFGIIHVDGNGKSNLKAVSV